MSLGRNQTTRPAGHAFVVALLISPGAGICALRRDIPCPRRCARTRCEAAAAFPPERISKLDDLSRWPRLRMVILEALRLYPPVPHLVRLPVARDEILGQPVRPGTQVWVSPWVMHRHQIGRAHV